MNLITLRETKELIESDPRNWAVHLMDVVDDFRYSKDPKAIAEPFEPSNERWDALLASTAHYLCDEVGIEVPAWILRIPACKDPWFVSGMESLKAIALVESPLQFRIRKVFVMENFLDRV
jgi:hypothetical protein